MIFLRPLWLLLLLCIPFFMRRTIHSKQSNPWRGKIAPTLAPFVLVRRGKIPAVSGSPILLLLLWILGVIALAGPAIKQKIPTLSQTPTTVVVWDVNAFQTEADLTKSKTKLYDLLNALHEDAVALVLVDKYPYIITPPTRDKDIIKTFIPAVNRTVMPLPLHEPQNALPATRQLLAEKPGQIILFTNTTTPIQMPDTAILNFSGTSVPGTVAATVTDDDIQTLIGGKNNTGPLAQSEQTLTDYRDLGIFILFPMIPLFLYLFRRHVLLLALLGICSGAQAGFLTNPAQDAYAEKMHGITLYRQGQFDKAAETFQSFDDADSLYNMGNASAFAGNIEQALSFYDQVLKQNPDHTDALFNKEYIEKQLPPDSSANGQNNESDTDETNNTESETDQINENDDPSQTDADQNTEQPDTPQQMSDTRQSEEPADSSEQTQMNQNTQQLYQKIQNDPSRLLRYRIYQQYKRQAK